MPSHTHQTSTPEAFANVASGGAFLNAWVSGSSVIQTGSAGSDGAHNHTFNMQLQYVDIIICQKG
jgi:hypothetical protein